MGWYDHDSFSSPPPPATIEERVAELESVLQMTVWVLVAVAVSVLGVFLIVVSR
jgi:hypothetical protein